MNRSKKKIKITSESFMDELLIAFKESRCQEFVIINIGTDKCIGDSYAPLLGTMLEECNKINNIHVYGTLDEPIHALNMHKKIENIKKNHPNAFFLAIDACLGKENDIGEIFLRDSSIKPGAGMGKKLPSVGHYSIIAIVDNADSDFINFKASIRLSFIRKLSLITFNKLVELDNQLRSYNKEEDLYAII